MEAIDLEIAGVKLIKPAVFGDSRGFFMESYNQARFTEAGIPDVFVQDNHSKSARNVVRGLHYQVKRSQEGRAHDVWQGKLVRCVRGRILDVAVDIRPDSSTYGQWVSAELTDENHHQLWVPAGFAHGFSVLSETAEVIYKVTDFWSKDDEKSLIWNDPDLAIDWRLDGEPVLSERDALNPRFRDIQHEA